MKRQAPTSGKFATLYSQRMDMVMHPALRIGFLDAMNGHPIDHDHIIDRIERETPPNALKRIGWQRPHRSGLFPDPIDRVALAQYRYEEGRLMVKQFGLKCRAWGHPDFPPKAVVEVCRNWPSK